ncbi:acyltransferase family protein [Falsarthrobacter nasiphocae]|uniref:acyltransferase family protein n=1 Tax=Falsarthrobacter nasiphocae TaxID=189863 RepID=UPI0031DF2190
MKHSRPRYAVLDILRAAAVLLVIAYHALPGALPAGYLGVDLFFVLSGFLITRGLLARAGERLQPADGRDPLTLRAFFADFYLKRVRRLAPAFAFMLLGTCALALSAPDDVRVRLGRQVLGAVTSTANWVQLAAGSSYFDAGTPQLLKHMWSLAVEEQFYLVWPWAVLAAAASVRGRARPLTAMRARLRAWTAGAAAASALGMAGVWLVTRDLNQAYLNTFTHASGILLGACVACLPVVRQTRPLVRWAAGAAALSVLLASQWLLPDTAPASQLGGIFVFSLAAAILVRLGTTGRLASVNPQGPLAGAWRWVADRSYALYLWHWPLLVLAAAWLPDPTGGEVEPHLMWGRACLAVGLTFALAEASARLLEQPVLRWGFRGALRRAAGARKRLAAGAAVAVALTAATLVAVVTAPAVTADQARLEALQQKSSRLAEPPTAPPTGPPTPAPTGSAAPPGTAESQGIDSRTVTFIGDSVTVAASDAIRAAYPQSALDAHVGQQMWDAPERIKALDAQGRLGQTVVVALGTNGSFTDENLESVVAAGGPERRFVFVTGYGPQPWIAEVNARLHAYAQAHRDRVRLAEWDQAAPTTGDIASDGVHPGPTASRAWVETVTRAVKSF